MAYDGALASAIKEYNFCNICKEKLEVEQDKQDESWYFVDAKAIKHKITGNGDGPATTIVHSQCLKKVEAYKA